MTRCTRHARVLLQLVNGEATQAPALTQCFEYHIEPDLVPVLEAIGNRLGGVVDAHLLAFDQVRLHALRHGLTAVAHDPQGRVLQFRPTRAMVNRHPHLRGELRTDVMELQGTQERHDGVRHGRADERQAMLLGDVVIRRAIEAARDARVDPMRPNG